MCPTSVRVLFFSNLTASLQTFYSLTCLFLSRANLNTCLQRMASSEGGTWCISSLNGGVQYEQAGCALSSAGIDGQMGGIAFRRGVCVCVFTSDNQWSRGYPGDILYLGMGQISISSCSHSFSSFSFSSMWWNISFYFLLPVTLTFLFLCCVLLTSQLPQFSLYFFLCTYIIIFAIEPEELLLLLAYDQTLLEFPKKQEGAYLEK